MDNGSRVRKIIIVCLIAMIVLVSAAAEASGSASYECGAGDNKITCTFTDGKLVFISESGDGKMKNNNNNTYGGWNDTAAKRQGIVAAEFGNGITHIGGGSLLECVNLKEATLPETLKSIGVNSFRGTSSLQSIVIPERVDTISTYAFTSSGLESVTIPGSVEIISSYAFNSCANLKSAVLQDGVKEIRSNAFSQCPKLTEVMIPESVTSIGSSAFSNDGELKSVYIPAGVTKIENNAFYKSPNVVISCLCGTYAEKYCVDNGKPHVTLHQFANGVCVRCNTAEDEGTILPKTGDAFDLPLWIALCAVSLTVLIVTGKAVSAEKKR